MFRKLGWHLTLHNLLIQMVVLAIISVFAFLGSAQTNTGDVTEAMWNAALTGALPDQGRWHNRNEGQGHLMLISTDSQGTFTNVDTQMEMPAETCTQIAILVWEKPESNGVISYNNEDFIYLRFIEGTEAGVRIVLQESISLGQALLSFLSRIIPMLIVSIVLICIASLAITARALGPIKRAWARQVEFTGDASHELRTPIAVIQANLDVVMDEPEQSVYSMEKWLANIKAETDRMQKLVEDLLTLSRSDEGHQVLQKTVFSLSDELLKTIEPLIPYVENIGIRLNSDIPSGIQFWGDAERIKQLIVILVDNAVKHTPAGGEVMVHAEIQSRTLHIKVSDTGEGMEKEHLAKIFDRFYRIDKARERESGGSGLGLSIAKWIVEQHRGTIHVTSTPRTGSTFIVELPI